MHDSKTLSPISWTVIDPNALTRKDVLDWFRETHPEILAFQEVRALPERPNPNARKPEGSSTWFHPAERKGQE